MVTIAAFQDSYRFEHRGQAVGRYERSDVFKPYVDDLRSLQGRQVSLTKPHDHRHHKGLMFSLSTNLANFWEEEPHELFPVIGRQVIERSDAVLNGVDQQLRWQADDGRTIFTEERRVSVDVRNNSVVWNWSSHLTAATDVTLTQSPWAEQTPLGRINYHGLGLRMPRSVTAMNHPVWFASGLESERRLVLGTRGQPISIETNLDGEFPVPRVRLTLESLSNEDGSFVMDDPFAFMSTGPSITQEVRLDSGELLECDFRLTIEDLN